MPLTVLIATSTLFKAVDSGDPRFQILATLVSGVLRFEVVAQLPTGQ